MFSNKKVLISGGTGSFGTQMLKSLIKTKVQEIRIFSRDEKKQEDLRRSIIDKGLIMLLETLKIITLLYLVLKISTMFFKQLHLNRYLPVNFFLWKPIKLT